MTPVRAVNVDDDRQGATGSPVEPSARQHVVVATTIYFWWHTCPRSGKRRRTRYRLSADEARQRLLEPVRIDQDALTVEPAAITRGGHWRSGLVAGVAQGLAADPAPECPPSVPSMPSC
jgi:hypothetical protein